MQDPNRQARYGSPIVSAGEAIAKVVPGRSGATEPSTPPNTLRRCRLALTGGPGGGKTTAADLFRRELGERVVVVPESATILFAGGFPRSREGKAQRAVQTAIFQLSLIHI